MLRAGDPGSSRPCARSKATTVACAYETAPLPNTIITHAPRVLAFTSLTGGRAAARAFGAGNDPGEQDWTTGPAKVWILPSSAAPTTQWPYTVRLAAWRVLAQALSR